MLKLRCPNCKGLLYYDNDGSENYLVCVSCAREYDIEGIGILTPRRMLPRDLKKRKGLKACKVALKLLGIQTVCGEKCPLLKDCPLLVLEDAVDNGIQQAITKLLKVKR